MSSHEKDDLDLFLFIEIQTDFLIRKNDYNKNIHSEYSNRVIISIEQPLKIERVSFEAIINIGIITCYE